MFQQILDRVSMKRALLVVPIALFALGLVVFPSRGSAQEDPETDATDQRATLAIEECRELRTEVFPEIEGVLDEIVNSGIVDQEQAEGIYGFVHDIADTGCAAASIVDPQDALATIADLTNTSESEVIQGIHEHGSLAAFANAHGVSEEELVDAVLGQAEANADSLVESGEIDQDTADKALALIEMLVTKGVNAGIDGGWEMPEDGWQMPGR